MELNAFICDDARVAHDGRLELSGVMNELYAPAFPARQGRLVLVALLVWDAGERGSLAFSVTLESADGASIFTIEGRTEVADRERPDAPPKTQLVLPLHNVTFPCAGMYRFMFDVLGKRVSGPALYVLEHA